MRNIFKLKKKNDVELGPEEAIIKLHLNGNNLEVSVQWHDINIDTFGIVLAHIASGNIIDVIVNEIKEACEKNNDMETLEKIINAMENHKSQVVQNNRNMPIVAPSQAIRHQITMYQPG